LARQQVRESRVQQELLVASLKDRTRLAYVRYRGGVDTLLSALDADRDLFGAELTLSQIRLNELLTVVQLYKALGGGWRVGRFGTIPLRHTPSHFGSGAAIVFMTLVSAAQLLRSRYEKPQGNRCVSELRRLPSPLAG